MASAIPQNRVYLFRLQTLIIDGGLLVLRHIFDHKLQLQNISFSVCLNQEKPTLTHLKSRNIITQYQYDELYPVTGQPQTTSHLDITLIICLLRNLKICGLNRKYNWNIPPQPGDTCLEADIYRLKQYRNEIAHIATTTGINSNDFASKWTEIEQILKRLGLSGSHPVSDLQKIIDEIKTSPLDPKAVKRIEKTIKQWKEMEKSLEVDIELVKKDMQVLKGEMKEVRKGATDTQKRFTDIESKISKIEEHDLRRSTNNETDNGREEYLKKRNNLKDDLITLYRHQFNTLPLSPLFEKHDTPLLDLYVMPDINKIEMSFGGGKSNVTSLHDVFYKKTMLCREIYLVANAGLGKTAFGKRLALTWCQSHKFKEDETKYFDKEETNAMSEFEFVFLLLLRDCSEECDIDQMIRKQILPRLAHTSDMIIENVLSEEKCLVILDGLDEWVHPTSPCAFEKSEIPHRKARECTTIITTSRPWKLSSVDLNASQIDQKFELDGLSKISSSKLKESVITLLKHKAEDTIEDQVKHFDSIVEDKGVSDLEYVPLLLMYLLCLCCAGIDLGRSKCIIYCQIVELLLKRTFKRYPEMQNVCLHSKKNTPQCFGAHTNCRENYTFLSSLGELAFETFFSKTRESSLVFDRLVVEKYLNADFLKLSLRSGIITQDREDRLMSEEQKYSFAHKTVQEFFAALHISTCSDQDKVMKKVFFLCNSVKVILELSEVYIFMIGINPELFSLVSEKLMKVINEDEITSIYRSVTFPTDYEKYVTPVKEFQDLLISCMKEIPENSDFKMCIQDLRFDKACQEENYYSNLQRLAVQNKVNIKSISIVKEGIRSLPEIVKDCELNDPAFNYQKIYYQGECEEAELIPLLSRSVKSVTIKSCEWQNDLFKGKFSSWSPELSKIVHNNNQLKAINIQYFTFLHNILEEFLNYLLNRKTMKEIGLYNLYCTEHGPSCDGFNFDLSQHTELKSLGLEDIPLSQLNVIGSLLEECVVGYFSNSGILKSYLRNISAASKLQAFTCISLKSAGEIQTMLQTLSLLVTVKRVELSFMNLGESLLPHQIVNIEYVWLLEVTMSSLSLRNLLSWMENLPQQVSVAMKDCTITPEIEFEDVKKFILESEEFVLVYDGKLLDGSYAFVFKSRK